VLSVQLVTAIMMVQAPSWHVPLLPRRPAGLWGKGLAGCKEQAGWGADEDG